MRARAPSPLSPRCVHLAVVALAAAAAFAVHPAAAWVASHNSIGAPSATPTLTSAATLDGAVPVAWPVSPIAPPAEGCVSPALSVVKVLAVVLGALAAIKLPLVLAKVLLAKVLLLLPLALPLALPLLLPFMMIAAMLPLPLPGFGMDDSPAADPSSPANPAMLPNAPAGGGNASPVAPGGDAMEARGAWVERCVQRVACQLNSRGSRKECARFQCAALDWLGGT